MNSPAPFPRFDRSRLRLKPLAQREHGVPLSRVLPLDAPAKPFGHPEFPELVARLLEARRNGRPVVMMMGAHVIKRGLGRFIIELMKRGFVTHLAMNGACAIHDFELALAGGTSEDVERYIQEGQFGLWEDTGRLHDAFREGLQDGYGMGQAVGRYIEERRLPHRDISVFASAWNLGVKATVHVSVGFDIIHEFPNCDGAMLGEGSYRDFLVFAKTIEDLEGGVMLNVGTAVMGPEVYLKALAMARNVARQEGRQVRNFTTAVFDLQDLPETFRSKLPEIEAHNYYRPWKTILVRTVKDGGQSYYFRGDHSVTIPSLLRELTSAPAESP